MLFNLHLRVRFFYELVKKMFQFFPLRGEDISFSSFEFSAAFRCGLSLYLRPLVPQFLSMEPGILCENPACQGVAHCGRRLTM